MTKAAGSGISAVVVTKDEEVNLERCLSSLHGWCGPIFVVDSGSTDRTEEMARRFGAEFLFHPFETHAKQWNWALNNLPLRGGWVLALDADQQVTPGLREEILQAVREAPGAVDGYYLPKKQYFRGQWLRHGGYWPKHLLKLFRAGSARCDEQELVDFRFYVRGETRLLKQPLIEDNAKERDITFWLGKHLRFVELHAQEEFIRRHRKPELGLVPSLRGTPDQKTLRLKEIWYRLPPLLRPFPYFLYRYLFRLGFLDGAQGALYYFLHDLWYELMIAVRLKELERKNR